MNIREALLRQSPSLALQRAAADEIARLDSNAASLRAEIVEMLRDVQVLRRHKRRLLNLLHRSATSKGL